MDKKQITIDRIENGIDTIDSSKRKWRKRSRRWNDTDQQREWKQMMEKEEGEGK